MQEVINFLYPEANPEFEILAIMDGISKTNGHNGYIVTVMEAVWHQQRKTLAKFTIGLNGKLSASLLGDFNKELCNQFDLGSVIISKCILDSQKI